MRIIWHGSYHTRLLYTSQNLFATRSQAPDSALSSAEQSLDRMGVGILPSRDVRRDFPLCTR